MVFALRKVARALWLCVATLLIVFAAVLAALRIASSLAADYIPQLEILIGENLGTPVHIGALDIQWQGWEPQVKLRDVVLPGPTDGDELLRLQEVFFNFRLHKMLSGERRPVASILLQGIRILVHRDANGRIMMGGLQTDRAVSIAKIPGQDAIIMKVFNALPLVGHIGLLNGSVVFKDAVSGIDYVLPRADVRLQNKGGQHLIRANVQLPSELGERLDIRLDLSVGDAGFDSWQGTAYIAGRSLQLAAWQAFIADSPVALHSGVLDFSLWGDWHQGALQSIDARLAGEKIALSVNDLPKSDQARPWRLERFSTHARWQLHEKGWDLALSNMDIYRQQQRWARNALRLVVADNDQGETVIAGNGRFLPVADSIALALTGRLSDTPAGVQLRTMQPQGTLDNWQFEYNTALPLTEGVKIASEFNDIAYKASQDIPGIDNLHGALRVADATLELNVDAGHVLVDARPLFRETMQLDRITGRAKVQLVEKGVRVTAGQVIVENADLKARARFHVDYREGLPLMMDMQADFHDGQGHNGYKYLPVGIMDEELVEWIDRAVVGGTITRGSLLLRGSAEDFPYANNEGVFEVNCDMQGATLNYHPDWPIATGVDVTLRFFGPSLDAHVRKGLVNKARIDGVVARIADFEKPVIKLKGQVSTDMPELLHFATTGALAEYLYAPLNTVSGRGQARVALTLTMPIGQGAPPLRVDGGITLNNATFHSADIDTGFSAVDGTVHFNEAGVRAHKLRATALGIPLSIDVQPGKKRNGQSHTRVAVRGNMPVRRVLKKLAIPFAQHFTGASDWLVELDVTPPHSRTAGGGIDLTVRSDLVGTRIDLPAPLGKPAEQARPFAFSVRIAGPQRLAHWQVRYADIVSVVAKTPRETPAQKSVAFHFGGGDARPGEASGYYATGTIDVLDFDAWRDLVSKEVAKGSRSSIDNRFAGRIDAQLQIQRLHAFSAHIDDINLAVKSEKTAWQLNVDSDVLNGYARVQRPFDSGNALDIHCYNLNYDAMKADYVDSSAAVALLDPRHIPPFTVTLDKLLWKSYLLKRVNIVARPDAGGISLSPISIDHQYMRMRGNGLWTYQAQTGKHNTSLEMRFNSRNIGKALEEIGRGAVIGAGDGSLNVDLNWPGTLYSPDIQALQGKISLRFNKGRILPVDPGAGRLVGLLALRELPRHLLFDFNDATEEGTEFNTVIGEMTLSAGIVHTQLLRMLGAIGLVEARGRSSLLEKTYDYNINVLPQLGNTLPLIGALATGGLTAGVTVFFTDTLLKELGLNVDQLSKRKYTLTGSWDAPVFQQVE